MLALGLAFAVAGEPVVPRSGDPVPWIGVREAHMGKAVHCDAATVVAATGRVSSVVVSGCEEPWKTATETTVATWRYAKGTPDQTVGVDYPAPTVIRRVDGDQHSLDEAATLFNPWRLVKNKLDLSARGARQRTRCDVEFFVDGYGLVYGLDLTACPKEVRVLAEHRLMRYVFEPETTAGRGLVPVRFRTFVVIR